MYSHLLYDGTGLFVIWDAVKQVLSSSEALRIMIVIIVLTLLCLRAACGRSVFMVSDKNSPHPPIEIIRVSPDPPPPPPSSLSSSPPPQLFGNDDDGGAYKKKKEKINGIRLSEEVERVILMQGGREPADLAQLTKTLLELKKLVEDQNKELRERVDMLEDWVHVEQQLLDIEHEQRVKAHVAKKKK